MGLIVKVVKVRLKKTWLPVKLSRISRYSLTFIFVFWSVHPKRERAISRAHLPEMIRSKQGIVLLRLSTQYVTYM